MGEREAEIVAATLTPPGNATHWSARRLAAKVKVSKSAVHRGWQDYRLQPHREKTFKFSDNVSSTVYATAYNVTDVMKTTMINEAKVPTTLDQPSDVNKPRCVQLGIRFSFR